MKKFHPLTLLLLLLSTSQLFSQVPSDCTVPPILKQAYARDIINLSMTAMYQTQSPDTLYVHVPAAQSDPIAGGLAAIYNATSLPERDSVFNYYCVHDQTSAIQTYSGYLIQVDTNYAWTQAWQNLTTLTGNSQMDAMLTDYDLHIDQFFNWSFGNYALLETDSLWNNRALIDSLETVAGVIYGEPNSIFGAAGKIEYTKVGADRYYDFYFEFNDCFDGCDNYHVWHFKVLSDCSVSYLGYDDWGFFSIEPLPAPLNCNISTSKPDPSPETVAFTVFPNPFHGDAQLRFTLPQAEEVTIDLYNAAGTRIAEVFKAQVEAGKQYQIPLDATHLSQGIYFCTLRTANGLIRTQKLLVQ